MPRWLKKYLHFDVYLVLIVGLLVFYLPIIVSARTMVAGAGGGGEDVVGHMLWSLGDDRPAGRFFPYFDLASNTRLWGNDVKYNPLHLTRLVSIALGSSQIGWGIIIGAIHGLLFLTVYYYSRRVFGIAKPAAILGGAVAFFHTSWLEWTATVYWTPSAILLVIAVLEYWLFTRTGKRRHLVLCIVANSLHPYFSQSQTLAPTQVYLLGAVLLMAFYRRSDWLSTIKPLMFVVWPITLLGWIPIITPMLFALGSGFVARSTEVVSTAGWQLNSGAVTQFVGLLTPSPSVVGVVLKKLSLSEYIWRPNPWLFGSFFFVPGILILWRSQRRAMRMVVAGTIIYGASILVADLVTTPFPIIDALGFWRVFAFPAISGFIVAAAIHELEHRGWSVGAVKMMNYFYMALLGVASITFLVLLMIDENTLADLGSRAGLVDSGEAIRSVLISTRVFTAGIAIALMSYLWATSRGLGSSYVTKGVWLLAIAAPVLTLGYLQGWHSRPPALDPMLEIPPEVRFLQSRIPSYEYRVGVVLASEMHLARGNREEYLSTALDQSTVFLRAIRQNDVRLRYGLGYAIPRLHFYTPYQVELREQANATLKNLGDSGGDVLNQRNIVIDPQVPILEEYGVRYWLSDYDLEGAYSGKFRKVFNGDYAAVYENAAAKPVAYFVDEPLIPISLANQWNGFSISLPPNQEGQLSIHVDLRDVNAEAVGTSGVESDLPPRQVGHRWLIDVPADTAEVIFTARESDTYTFLVPVAILGFLVALFIVGSPFSNTHQRLRRGEVISAQDHRWKCRPERKPALDVEAGSGLSESTWLTSPR